MIFVRWRMVFLPTCDCVSQVVTYLQISPAESCVHFSYFHVWMWLVPQIPCIKRCGRWVLQVLFSETLGHVRCYTVQVCEKCIFLSLCAVTVCWHELCTECGKNGTPEQQGWVQKFSGSMKDTSPLVKLLCGLQMGQMNGTCEQWGWVKNLKIFLCYYDWSH